ncbi:uncharacterized protein LOC127751518 [Frankliniella occidentalis]|uniref:Uncharacterized protein LOC127751518 n=1 Tax=Frankliniella occidentalis TaxID=133901 RepID=A0A9C6X8R1_FRAOC|nr:uncharacterized protein LOC127751518 [Frankliniella occidentalis]XP_052131143.1 uncharacterized protein LOC127751518 [Frankliniella occidentalis]
MASPRRSIMMSYILVAVLVLLCQSDILCKNINSFAGPYIVYNERFYMSELKNRTFLWKWNLHATRFNPYKPREIQLLTGNVTGVNVSIDDNCWAKVILDTWKNNQWKENAFVIFVKDKACTHGKINLPGFYEQLFKKRETKGACIVKPGVYELKNAPVKLAFPNFPIMPYGRYRFKLTVGRTELYTCMVSEVTIIPKMD